MVVAVIGDGDGVVVGVGGDSDGVVAVVVVVRPTNH